MLWEIDIYPLDGQPDRRAAEILAEANDLGLPGRQPERQSWRENHPVVCIGEPCLDLLQLQRASARDARSEGRVTKGHPLKSLFNRISSLARRAGNGRMPVRFYRPWLRKIPSRPSPAPPRWRSWAPIWISKV